MTTKYHHEVITSAPTLEVKADAQGRITGYGAVFGNADRQGDIVMAGAFTKSLQRIKATGDMPVMLWSHAQEQPIGRWTSITEDGKGLRVDGVLNLKTERGRDAYEHVKAGDAGGLSIGYQTPKGGREYAGQGIFHLKEVDLFEISVVSVPANPMARIEGVKSIDSKADAVDMLRGAGLSKKAANLFAAGGWTALAGGYDETKLKRLAESIDAATSKMKG